MTEISRKLIIAARNGRVKECDELLKLNPPIDFAEPPFIRSALWYAASRGHDVICKRLGERGADVNIADISGYTALHVACRYGHLKTIEVLIDRNSDPNALDDNDRTPIMIAAQFKQPLAVECLMKAGAELNALDKNGYSVAHISAFVGLSELSQNLFENGAYANRYLLQK